jgi:hypothetical protein
MVDGSAGGQDKAGPIDLPRPFTVRIIGLY